MVVFLPERKDLALMCLVVEDFPPVGRDGLALSRTHPVGHDNVELQPYHIRAIKSARTDGSSPCCTKLRGLGHRADCSRSLRHTSTKKVAYVVPEASSVRSARRTGVGLWWESAALSGLRRPAPTTAGRHRMAQ